MSILYGAYKSHLLSMIEWIRRLLRPLIPTLRFVRLNNEIKLPQLVHQEYKLCLAIFRFVWWMNKEIEWSFLAKILHNSSAISVIVTLNCRAYFKATVLAK